MALNNCIFEELLKAAHLKRGLFVIQVSLVAIIEA